MVRKLKVQKFITQLLRAWASKKLEPGLEPKLAGG
jgi:hypothetical protein